MKRGTSSWMTRGDGGSASAACPACLALDLIHLQSSVVCLQPCQHLPTWRARRAGMHHRVVVKL